MFALPRSTGFPLRLESAATTSLLKASWLFCALTLNFSPAPPSNSLVSLKSPTTELVVGSHSKDSQRPANAIDRKKSNTSTGSREEPVPIAFGTFRFGRGIGRRLFARKQLNSPVFTTQADRPRAI